jgi:predicted transcriptional regulator
LPNILSNLFGGGGKDDTYLEPRSRIPIVFLTEDGKNKLSTLETDSIDYRIMSEVSQMGTANIDEIAQHTNIPRSIVRNHLRDLHSQGYVGVRNART